MLDHIDALTAQFETLGARIEDVIAPFSHDVERFDEITAVGKTAAQELIAEIGVDATRFPDAAHLVSWAKFAPIDHNSAGRKRGGATGRGNPWLAGTLGVIVASASRTDTFLGERYRRLARRRGKNRHRRDRQLGPDHHLAPTRPPRRPLQRPRLRPLPNEGQHPASGTRPHPPARTPHRQEGHPGIAHSRLTAGRPLELAQPDNRVRHRSPGTPARPSPTGFSSQRGAPRRRGCAWVCSRLGRSDYAVLASGTEPADA